ncbi:hypothetical protein BBF93_00210 [Hyphomonas sp. CACIAM 19H1]|uniref:hypothetical protein n=1 Tax=Hyphomonas sp. CACIAM 19H1 TaxID=1873716 RepID=UPI000DEDC145|nr:hypothetical protein [Hyphomonas sp. CACIAM 19H1]AXE62805.1 hypothetical protein BBF93_00210 [Hyphomonas sp. CACIAM 19H1]
MAEPGSLMDASCIRFDAASELIAQRDPAITRLAALDLLVRAVWNGDFEPPPLSLHWPTPAQIEARAHPDAWMFVPIELPRAWLTKEQAALSIRPVELFKAGRDAIINVMYCNGHLPGDAEGWHALLDWKVEEPARRQAEALSALARIPVSAYTAEARVYLASLIIPRAKLQAWLDSCSANFHGLFVSAERASPVPPAAANDTGEVATAHRRGRPVLAAWPMIEAAAHQINQEHPDLPRKVLAGQLHALALGEFDEDDVPNEATILRRLGSILGDAGPSSQNEA